MRECHGGYSVDYCFEFCEQKIVTQKINNYYKFVSKKS